METKTPFVSVVLPTYNRASLLGRAIQSVLSQTYKDLELIIVDDGSSDETDEVVRAFADSRIRYLKHPKNRGVSAARNTGMMAALGEFIAFQDSDDEWLPDKLEKQLGLFEQDKVGDLGLVLCEYLVVSDERVRRLVPEVDQMKYETLLAHFGAHGEGTQRFLLKRALTATELYFDEKLPAWEEWDLLLRVSRICRVDYVRDALVRYYRHGGPHVDNPRNRLKARRVLIRKYASEFESRPRAVSLSYWQSALDCHELGRMGSARCYLRAAVKAYPWNPDLHLQFVASLFGRRFFRMVLATRHVVGSLLRVPRSFIVRSSQGASDVQRTQDATARVR